MDVTSYMYMYSGTISNVCAVHRVNTLAAYNNYNSEAWLLVLQASVHGSDIVAFFPERYKSSLNIRYKS